MIWGKTTLSKLWTIQLVQGRRKLLSSTTSTASAKGSQGGTKVNNAISNLIRVTESSLNRPSDKLLDPAEKIKSLFETVRDCIPVCQSAALKTELDLLTLLKLARNRSLKVNNSIGFVEVCMSLINGKVLEKYHDEQFGVELGNAVHFVSTYQPEYQFRCLISAFLEIYDMQKGPLNHYSNALGNIVKHLTVSLEKSETEADPKKLDIAIQFCLMLGKWNPQYRSAGFHASKLLDIGLKLKRLGDLSPEDLFHLADLAKTHLTPFKLLSAVKKLSHNQTGNKLCQSLLEYLESDAEIVKEFEKHSDYLVPRFQVIKRLFLEKPDDPKTKEARTWLRNISEDILKGPKDSFQRSDINFWYAALLAAQEEALVERTFDNLSNINVSRVLLSLMVKHYFYNQEKTREHPYFAETLVTHIRSNALLTLCERTTKNTILLFSELGRADLLIDMIFRFTQTMQIAEKYHVDVSLYTLLIRAVGRDERFARNLLKHGDNLPRLPVKRPRLLEEPLPTGMGPFTVQNTDEFYTVRCYFYLILQFKRLFKSISGKPFMAIIEPFRKDGAIIYPNLVKYVTECDVNDDS